MNTATEFRSIQCFPAGKMHRYAGEYPNYIIKEKDTERPCTEDEARSIRRNELAELYIEREILCNDSCLVDELLKLNDHRILEGAFEWDEVENQYVDPSDWEASDCIEYMDEYGIEYTKNITPSVDEIIDAIRKYQATNPPEEDTDIHLVWSDDGWYVTHDYLPDQWRDWTYESDYALSDISEVAHSLRDAMNDELDQDIDEWKEKIRDHSSDNPNEVYQWFRVTSWLCDQLRSIGEVVLDNGYGCWWGRGCCGQSVIMDGTIQKIADRFL